MTEVDQVWCTDITYLPMDKGHAYLVATMDWKGLTVLSWEVSNTMDSAFCVRLLYVQPSSEQGESRRSSTLTRAANSPSRIG